MNFKGKLMVEHTWWAPIQLSAHDDKETYPDRIAGYQQQMDNMNEEIEDCKMKITKNHARILKICHRIGVIR